MKKYIAILEIEDDCEIVGDIYASISYTYRMNGTNYATLEHGEFKPLTNHGWIDFLSEEFNISRSSAKEMLHTMMSVKKEDNFKKRFSGRK